MKTNKYYIIRRNNNETLNAFFERFTPEQRKSFLVNTNDDYLLIEKTCLPDNTEQYTGLCTFSAGVNELWQRYTKSAIVYDYTGIELVVWVNKEPHTWSDYDFFKK